MPVLRIFGDHDTEYDRAMNQKRQDPRLDPQSRATQITIQEAFSQHYMPARVQGRAKATVASLRTTVRLWGEFLEAESANLRITNPNVRGPMVIDEIDESVVVQFQRWIMDMRKCVGATADLHWRNLRTICRSVRILGKPAWDRQLMIESQARATCPSHGIAPPRILSNAELDGLYEACSVATWPPPSWRTRTRSRHPDAQGTDALNRVPAPLWWRTALMLWLITGLRRRDVASDQASKPGLRISDLHLRPECPYSTTSLRHEPGWLWRMPTKTRRSGKLLVLPLPVPLRRQLDLVLALHGPDYQRDCQLLPCPGSEKNFNATWYRINAAASAVSGQKPCSVSDLRPTANMLWHRAGDGLGDVVLCHDTSVRVNARHYRNDLPRLVAGVAHLDLPWGTHEQERIQDGGGGDQSRSGGISGSD